MQLEPIQEQKSHQLVLFQKQNPTLKLPQPLLGKVLQHPVLFHQVTKVLPLELAKPDLELITWVMRISNGNVEAQTLEEQEEEEIVLKEAETEAEMDQVITTNIQICQIPHLSDYHHVNQTKKT